MYQSKSHKKTQKLFNQYLAGQKDRNSQKAAYIIHDTIQKIADEYQGKSIIEAVKKA